MKWRFGARANAVELEVFNNSAWDSELLSLIIGTKIGLKDRNLCKKNTFRKKVHFSFANDTKMLSLPESSARWNTQKTTHINTVTTHSFYSKIQIVISIENAYFAIAECDEIKIRSDILGIRLLMFQFFIEYFSVDQFFLIKNKQKQQSQNYWNGRGHWS